MYTLGLSFIARISLLSVGHYKPKEWRERQASEMSVFILRLHGQPDKKRTLDS